MTEDQRLQTVKDFKAAIVDKLQVGDQFHLEDGMSLGLYFVMGDPWWRVQKLNGDYSFACESLDDGYWVQLSKQELFLYGYNFRRPVMEDIQPWST
jgi:hypothetical protein